MFEIYATLNRKADLYLRADSKRSAVDLFALRLKVEQRQPVDVINQAHTELLRDGATSVAIPGGMVAYDLTTSLESDLARL